jgi:hypothetical protein
MVWMMLAMYYLGNFSVSFLLAGNTFITSGYISA